MIENYFFELPIYRCTEKKYNAEFNAISNRIKKDLKVKKRSLPDCDFSETENALLGISSYPYLYNDVVGWIRLYVLGSQLRGEYYFEVSTKYPYGQKLRFNKGIRKKRIEYKGKAFELSISRDKESKEIFNSLCAVILRINKNETPFIKRHIDTSHLMKVGPFIDWKNLMSQLNPYNTN